MMSIMLRSSVESTTFFFRGRAGAPSASTLLFTYNDFSDEVIE